MQLIQQARMFANQSIALKRIPLPEVSTVEPPPSMLEAIFDESLSNLETIWDDLNAEQGRPGDN